MSRIGNFSSSKVSDLMSKGRGNWSIENIGKPFLTYVKEKVRERKLGRSISSENSAKSTAWGTLCEEQAFNKMDLKYSLVSKDRFYHKNYKDYWSGIPDIATEELIGDIKCPWTLTAFCDLVESMDSPELLKINHPNYYWQLVSNAILCEKDTVMLIVYCPYKEDLNEIKELAREHAGDLNNRFAFINWSEDEELPYLIKGKGYNDINMLEFEVPKEDKAILTQRVELAISELKNQLK